MWSCLLGSGKLPEKVNAQLGWWKEALLTSLTPPVSLHGIHHLSPLRALQANCSTVLVRMGVEEDPFQRLGGKHWGRGTGEWEEQIVTSLKPSGRTSSKFPRVRHASIVPAQGSRAGSPGQAAAPPPPTAHKDSWFSALGFLRSPPSHLLETQT